MSSKENKGISLDHCVEIYVPNLCLDGKQLPEELRGELLKEVKTKFSSWFGGTSRKEPRVDRIEGSWLHESGELANEPIDIVYSNTDAESLEEYFEELPVLANEIATRLKQEAVAFRVDGKMTLIYGDSSGALERREPKEIELKCALQASLMRVSSLKDIRDLFINLLHYDHESTEIATLDWPDSLQDLLAKNTLPEVIAGYNGFKIIHLQLTAKDLRKGQERQLIQRIRKDDPTLRALFVVSNYKQNQWHLINTKDTQEDSKTTLHLRFFRIGEGQQVRTAAERLHLIDIEALDSDITAQELQDHHNDAFDVESVSQDFFNEISNWYFWALSQVDFPQDTVVEGEEEKHRATSLIRFLTRIIFCWFLKEKGLIPESLFNRKELEVMLVDLDEDHCTYHEGILQNLFFATLNQRMGKDSKTGEAYRAFAKDEGFVKNRSTYGIDTLYRYEEHFNDEAKALGYFAEVPFLNGGLFECLDRTDDDGKKLYLDGFSRNKKKRSRIPNKLFFAPPQTVDLSGIYDDPSRRNSTVRGLLNILHAYNFTVEENTPVDEEIALDPELLGKVFENLLASYNEETKTTARKQTGSFYTPRAIVEFMVDESLKAHLYHPLIDLGRGDEEAKALLDSLLGYADEAIDFSEQETKALLESIHTCKILDPACGSGAFPMGMLQKLVHVVQKLDPDNFRWKQIQIDKASEIPDPSAQDAAIKAIKRDFEENGDDYGRKLYLIERCLYGTDIQPVAIQISKLRFFISLICDQNLNRSKAKNHGIRALPNLETKFVAADSLIKLPVETGDLFEDARLKEIELELSRLYHSHFSLQRRDQKLSVQKKIKALREEMTEIISHSLGFVSSEKARLLAEWDPFNTQAVAGFFDPKWMFGQSLSKGFDMIIGNPPYLFLSGKGSLVQKLVKEGKQQQAKTLKAYFDRLTVSLPSSSKGCRDYYKWFIDRGLDLIVSNGVLVYITPNTFLTLNRYADVRQLLFGNVQSNSKIVDLGFDVFEVPIVPSAIIVTQRNFNKRSEATIQYADLKQVKGTFKSAEAIQKAVLDEAIEVTYKEPQLLLFKHPLAESIYLKSSKFGIDYFKATEGEHCLDMSRLLPGESSSRNVVPVVIDSELSRFVFSRQGLVPRDACQKFDSELHSGRRMFIRKTGDSIVCGFPSGENTAVAHQNVYVVKAHDPCMHWTVSAILNSSVATFLYRCGIHGQKGRVMAQFRVHALEAIPFPAEIRPYQATIFRRIVPLFRVATPHMRAFLEDLINACVMELYFRKHMEEKGLLLLEELAPLLEGFNSEALESELHAFLENLVSTLKAADIDNRMARIPVESPDLLAVIQEEGKV